MKALQLTLLFVLSGFLVLAKNSTVNAVIGDRSFVAKYGMEPDASIGEIKRIQTHLEFVENLLRASDTEKLTKKAKTNRLNLLNALHTYWKAGVFPAQSKYKGERRPCFIDAKGNICAVGYLIEQSAGRDVAEVINQKHQYAYLLDMNDPMIDHWAEENGFSSKELAMIQPTYGWVTPEPVIRPTPTIVFVDHSREIELQAQLDSMCTNYDEVAFALDSSLKVISTRNERISALEKKNQATLATLSLDRSNAKEKEARLRWAIYALSIVIVLIIAVPYARKLRSKKSA